MYFSYLLKIRENFIWINRPLSPHSLLRESQEFPFIFRRERFTFFSSYDTLSNKPNILRLKRGLDQVMIKKTKRLTLVEQVAIQMEDLIEAGQWEVGSKIPAEPELMEKFDVSRNTLREAIRALVHAGLLETRQGIGTTVKSASTLGLALEKKIQKSDLMETLEVRLALEKEAAKLSAERRTMEDLNIIEECLTKCKEAATNKDSDYFINMDIEFHKSVVRATHNQMFIELYDHITDALQNSVHENMRARRQLEDEYAVHTDLYEAIRVQDGHAAVLCVDAYLRKAKDSLYTMMEGSN